MPTGYWANFGKIHCQPAQGVVRGHSHAGKRPGFSWLPRVDGDYSQLAYFDSHGKGWGRRATSWPVRTPPAGRAQRRTLRRLACATSSWLVVLGFSFETGERHLLEERPECPTAV